MNKLIILAFTFMLPFAVLAESIYHSDGSSSSIYGNTIYNSDGSSSSIYDW